MRTTHLGLDIIKGIEEQQRVLERLLIYYISRQHTSGRARREEIQHVTPNTGELSKLRGITGPSTRVRRKGKNLSGSRCKRLSVESLDESAHVVAALHGAQELYRMHLIDQRALRLSCTTTFTDKGAHQHAYSHNMEHLLNMHHRNAL